MGLRGDSNSEGIQFAEIGAGTETEKVKEVKGPNKGTQGACWQKGLRRPNVLRLGASIEDYSIGTHYCQGTVLDA